MKLAFITPTEHLDYTKQGDILYVLSHLLKEPKYYDFIKQSKMYKILDNSVHEGEEISLDLYFKYACDLNIDEVILQDKLENKAETLKLKDEQLTKYYDVLHKNNIKIMGVVQGKNYQDIGTILTNYLKDDRIDVIGLSFTIKLENYSEVRDLDLFLNRNNLLHFINKFKINKPIHLLGSCSWLDVLYGKVYPFIRSNDTKLLSRLSYSGKKIEDVPIGKGKKITFEEKFNRQQLDLLSSNISKIKRITCR